MFSFCLLTINDITIDINNVDDIIMFDVIVDIGATCIHNIFMPTNIKLAAIPYFNIENFDAK